MSDIEGNYFTTSDYNKFTIDILDAKIKQKELVNNSDILIPIKKSELNTKLETLTTKEELKAEQEKIVQRQTRDLSYFLCIKVFGDDGSPNMFVYQPTFSTLQIKKIKAMIIFSVGDQKC